MLPPAFDVDRAIADVHVLVEQIGPRIAGTSEERAATARVRSGLREAGWDPISVPGGTVSCRGSGQTLLLAHVDSVPMSPGAVDNAGAVAVLLELARSSQAEDLCLGFPEAEEVGLVGSQKMVQAWPRLGRSWPDRVVALDLIGDGVPTAIDLSRMWGDARLDWLTHASPTLDIPFLHHTVGRALPQGRSDHGPFVQAGVPAFLVITRGEDGVFTRYHQSTDTTVDPRSLELTAAVLEGIATAPPLPPGERTPALVLLGMVLPGWLTWSVLAAGWISAASDIPRWRQALGTLWRGLLGAGLAAGAMALCLFLPWPVDAAEQAALIQARPGWWAATPASVATGVGVWSLLRWRLGGAGSAPLAAGILSGALTIIDPLAGLPMAMAAILSRIHPLLALLPLPLLLRVEALRELSFHGLVPPMAWGLVLILAWPAFGARPLRR
jgi:hypothetical protein